MVSPQTYCRIYFPLSSPDLPRHPACPPSPYPTTAIPFGITSFADPHHVTPIESNLYKKQGGTHFPPSSCPVFRLPVTYLESTFTKLIQNKQLHLPLESTLMKNIGGPGKARPSLRSQFVRVTKTGWRTFHSSVATALSEMREPVRTAQQVLGHSSAQTTLAYNSRSLSAVRSRVGKIMFTHVPKLEKGSSLIH
jgi:hypothetical protein